MSLSNALIRRCPLLLESDVISLSAGFEVDNHYLRDTRLRAAHQLTPPGEGLITVISGKGVRFDWLMSRLNTHDVRSIQLVELLGFLNNCGGLQCRERSWQDRLRRGWIRLLHLPLGIVYPFLAWRKPASVVNIGVGLLRATFPIIVSSGVVAALVYGAGFADLTYVLRITVFCLVLFTGSFVAHEYAHVLVITKTGRHADVLQVGMRVGIIHARLLPSEEIRSSAAGPLAGLICCLLFGGSAFVLQQAELILGAGVIAVLHSLSMLPWYGDGKSFYQALKERKHS